MRHLTSSRGPSSESARPLSAERADAGSGPRRAGLVTLCVALVLAACTTPSNDVGTAAERAVETTPRVSESQPEAPTLRSDDDEPAARASTTTSSVVAARTIPLLPDPDSEPPEPDRRPADGTSGAAVAAVGGMPYAAEPGADAAGLAHEGLVFAVIDRRDDWFELRTMCDTRVWAHSSGLGFTPAVPDGSVPGTMAFDEAVLVLDPGHGGPNLGATGPTGLSERIVNLDIARRVRDLLSAPRRIDWETGTVTDGTEVPAAATVWLTRVEGPTGADYDTGLLFRATLANSLGAHALVSIHNNAEPDGPTDGPGSEVFYRSADDQSMRLAGLMMEEFIRSFDEFAPDWQGDTDAGAKPRLRADEVTDYYGLLRNADVPAVLAEGAFISNPSEEALLRTPDFRHAYAEAVYRALVRFITTGDRGSGFTDPYPRTTPAGSGDPRPECEVPQQPQ